MARRYLARTACRLDALVTLEVTKLISQNVGKLCKLLYILQVHVHVHACTCVMYVHAPVCVASLTQDSVHCYANNFDPFTVDK